MDDDTTAYQHKLNLRLATLYNLLIDTHDLIIDTVNISITRSDEQTPLIEAFATKVRRNMDVIAKELKSLGEEDADAE